MFKIYFSTAKIKPLDIEENYRRADEEVKQAVDQGAKLVVFPMCFLTGPDIGILADSEYFAEMYNDFALRLSSENTGICILADTYDYTFTQSFILNGEILPIGDEEGLELAECRIKAYDTYSGMIVDVADMCENNAEMPDCIILTESAPVVAGERQLLKKLLAKVHASTGATVCADLGGYGFTSHPNVYMPCIAVIDEGVDIFTKNVSEYLSVEKCFEISTGVNGTGEYLWENMQEMAFEVRYSENPLVPVNVDEKEYCLDLFSLQSKSLADRLSNINSKNAVVAVSGGLDSALALLVTVNAFDMLGLDRKGIHPISMPGFGTSSTTKGLGQQLIESLGFEFRMIDITKACTQALLDIGHDAKTPDVTFENVQARMRTVNGLNLANAVSGIFVGTGDLSEEALGFSTYGGDQLASYNVNASVSKTLIRTMLPYILELENISSAKDPITGILNIPVSPELVPHGGEILQKTEEILAPYKLIDFFIYCFVVTKLSPKEMAEKAKEVFKDEFETDYLFSKREMFCKRFISGQFKRSCAPEGARTTHVHLRGPERSVPSDSSMGVFRWTLKK